MKRCRKESRASRIQSEFVAVSAQTAETRRDSPDLNCKRTLHLENAPPLGWTNPSTRLILPSQEHVQLITPLQGGPTMDNYDTDVPVSPGLSVRIPAGPL